MIIANHWPVTDHSVFNLCGAQAMTTDVYDVVNSTGDLVVTFAVPVSGITREEVPWGNKGFVNILRRAFSVLVKDVLLVDLKGKLHKQKHQQ